jgi:excisionase family DNA binding protein
MSIGLRRGVNDIFDASAWISQSEAARLRGVSREAIYNLVKKNRFMTFKIGDKTLINREDVENYQPQPSGRKSKMRRNEAESTLSQGERPFTAQQNRGRAQLPGKRNKWLTMTEVRDRNLDDYISQSEAARIRGIAKQSIANLVRRGRLTSVTVAGRTLVLRSEVENFVAQPKLGRPPKKAISLKATKEKKPNK